MNVAKEIYFDERGMVRNTRYKNVEKLTKIDNPEISAGVLRLTGVAYQNSGCYFIFLDENNLVYYMSLPVFQEYIEDHPIVFDARWRYLKQGVTYSIGFVD